MKLMKLMCSFILIFLTSFVHARSEECRSAWTKFPATETHRLVIFRYHDMWITDPSATFSVLEGEDCVGGYYIDSLNVSSVVHLPNGEGTVENKGSCKTKGEVFYGPYTFPNYNFLRDVFNGANPPGIVEMDLSQPECNIRYFPDLKSYRGQFKTSFCSGHVGEDPVVTCQHYRHMRSFTR